jgi:hypothetical protein
VRWHWIWPFNWQVQSNENDRLGQNASRIEIHHNLLFKLTNVWSCASASHDACGCRQVTSRDILCVLL